MENFNPYNVEGNIFRLKNCELFDNLKAPALYEKNQMIYRQGDAADYVYYLKKGKVQIFISSAGGSEKILSIFSEGNLFGKSSFFDKMLRTSCAKALTKSEIIVIDKKMMADIISRRPDFALDLLEYLSKTVRMFSNQIENMSFLPADKRIARFLADNATNGKSRKIACTHDEIADLIGVSRVTVSKILGKFAQNGWIKTQYRSIKVINEGALSDFAFKET